MKEIQINDLLKIQRCEVCGYEVDYIRQNTTNAGYITDKQEFIKAQTMQIFDTDNTVVRIYLCPKCGAASMKIKTYGE